MSQIEQLIKHLNTQADELISLCNDYKRHNHALKTREVQLTEERAALMQKNDLARTKIEAMISRLKALEQES